MCWKYSGGRRRARSRRTHRGCHGLSCAMVSPPTSAVGHARGGVGGRTPAGQSFVKALLVLAYYFYSGREQVTEGLAPRGRWSQHWTKRPQRAAAATRRPAGSSIPTPPPFVPTMASFGGPMAICAKGLTGVSFIARRQRTVTRPPLPPRPPSQHTWSQASMTRSPPCNRYREEILHGGARGRGGRQGTGTLRTCRMPKLQSHQRRPRCGLARWSGCLRCSRSLVELHRAGCWGG